MSGSARDEAPDVSLTKGRLVVSSHAWQEVARSLRFSPREAQIVRGIFEDATQAAIALELGISQHTVHTYVERLYQKLGVASRVELVVCVLATLLEAVDRSE